MPNKANAARTRGHGRSRHAGIAPVSGTSSDLDEIKAAADMFAQLLGDADDHERQLLVDAVTPGDTDHLDENLWGPAPTPAETGAAQLTLLRRRFEARRDLEQQSVTRDQAAALLGVTAQMITEYLRKHELLGFKNGRSWLIPLWEFDADLKRGFLPGLAPLYRSFPGGVVTLTQWVLRASPDLDGRTPRDALAHGDVDEVLHVATSLTAAGW